MKRKRRGSGRLARAQAGFSLVELMAAVAIIGALSSIAIPGFVRYLRKSRTVEAVEGLHKLASGAMVYHANTQLLPGSASGFVPAMDHATACNINYGVFNESEMGGFDAEPWKSLLFGQSEKLRYRYDWRATSSENSADGQGFALGDLDCDGDMSLWRVWVFRSGKAAPLERRGPYLQLGSETE